MAVEKAQKQMKAKEGLLIEKKKNIKLLEPHNVMDERASLMDILKA